MAADFAPYFWEASLSIVVPFAPSNQWGRFRKGQSDGGFIPHARFVDIRRSPPAIGCKR